MVTTNTVTARTTITTSSSSLSSPSLTDPFHERLTFLVRSFFFVFVGLLASFGNIEYYVLAGIDVAITLLVARKICDKDK
jgi:NhaP-type Na+/H+ or K+/H+ antiporter